MSRKHGVNKLTHELSEKEYKKRVRAWMMYDWANSAFMTTVVAAVLPVYYSNVAGANLPSAAKATQYWGLTGSLAMIIIAIISPLLGTVSDIVKGKKKFLAIFMGIGVVATGLMYFINTGDWVLASALFIIGRVGVGGSFIFYDALLPHIAKQEDEDRISTAGYALGYLGGGILLIVNIVMISVDPALGVKWSFVTVAIWWLIFSVPILRNIPEPNAGQNAQKLPFLQLVTTSSKQLLQTVKNLRTYPDLLRYLIAFVVYSDGIGFIISMAAIYGAELGFESTSLIIAIVLIQFLGVLYSFMFGRIPQPNKPKQPIFTSFIILNIILMPIIGLAGYYLLPTDFTGRPREPFEATSVSIGQGFNQITDPKISKTGDWQINEFGEDVTDSNTPLSAVRSTQQGDTLEIPFNGKSANILYTKASNQGEWEILLDRLPIEDGTVNAYQETTRLNEAKFIEAETAGEHVLTIRNIGTNENGTGVEIAGVEILQPKRMSNLLGILGIITIIQLATLLVSWLGGHKLFSPISQKMNTKRGIILALLAYIIITIWGFRMNSVIEFWFIVWMVGMVQGGSQALSRSLFSSMTPKHQSGEFFGFFSILSKVASLISPIILTVSVILTDSSRLGVLSVSLLFIGGLLILRGVDVERGRKLARQIEAEYNK